MPLSEDDRALIEASKPLNEGALADLIRANTEAFKLLRVEVQQLRAAMQAAGKMFADETRAARTTRPGSRAA